VIGAENSQQQYGWTIHLTNVCVPLVIVWKSTLGSQIIAETRVILIDLWMAQVIGKIYEFHTKPH
tara:strand:- start:7474 stop:7668 length:195 start_codon:yes stop_codon:yes gene_type:complete